MLTSLSPPQLANCLLSSFSQTLDVCFSLIEDENEGETGGQEHDCCVLSKC